MDHNVQLQACHLIEEDLTGDILWIWSYPHLDEESRTIYLRKSKQLVERPSSRTQPFHYFHFKNLWVYIYFSERVPHVSVKTVALILTSLDFNPLRYSALCKILSESYCKFGKPVHLLQLFLSVLVSGKCVTEENETYYSAEFDSPNPFQNSQIASIIGRFGLETILIYTALLLRKKIVVYHHEISDLNKFVMSLPAFLPHREMWNLIYPWVDAYPDELLPFQLSCSESNAHIVGCTRSLQNQSNIYDLYINVPASEITIAPHAKEAMTMTKVHKDIAVFMVQLTQRKGYTESDIIHNINQKTKELIRNIRTTDVNEENADPHLDQAKKNENSSPLELFLFSLAQAESLPLNKIFK